MQTETPEERTPPDLEIPADAPEQDVLDQATPWAAEGEDHLPTKIPDDVPEADALDQARTVDLGDDEEGPA